MTLNLLLSTTPKTQMNQLDFQMQNFMMSLLKSKIKKSNILQARQTMKTLGVVFSSHLFSFRFLKISRHLRTTQENQNWSISRESISCNYGKKFLIISNGKIFRAERFTGNILIYELGVLYIFDINTFCPCEICKFIWFLIWQHCMKNVQIQSYYWSVFSCIQSKYRKIRTRNYSVFGHFSCSVNVNDVWYLRMLNFANSTVVYENCRIKFYVTKFLWVY